MKFHPACQLFPVLDGPEFDALVADIKEHGLREPISLHPDGAILDGRNRWKACQKAGVEPKFRTYRGEPLAFVVSENIRRRHLTTDQRAAIAVNAEGVLEKLRAETKRGGARTKGQRIAACPGKAVEQAARLFHTNREYVRQAEKLKAENPAALEAVIRGEKRLADVNREQKEAAREKRRDENRVLAGKAEDVAATGARFATIVADPPWDWGDEGDQDQLGRARPTYATLSFEQLLALPVENLADKDAHLYLWITNRSLPKGFALLERWGFRYVTCLTWCKPSIGMGNYFRGSTEHVLFGIRGSQPLLKKNVGTWFQAPRGKVHSSKPDEFFSLVESCSPGPYLELFARKPRPGWKVWGAEA